MERAILCLVQAAVLGGASQVHVRTGRLGTELLFDGQLDGVERLWEGLDAPAATREQFRRRQLALGVAGYLSQFPSLVQVDGWAFHARGCAPRRVTPPAPPLHRIAVWRVGGSDARLIQENTGFGYPEVRLDGNLVASHTCTGFPSLGATNSQDPAVTLESLKRRLHFEVPLPEDRREMSVLLALDEDWPGRLTIVCAGVRVAELTDLEDLPGVRGQVTLLDPATLELADPHALVPLVQDVWLRGVCARFPKEYRDRLIPPLRWLLGRPPGEPLRRLQRVPLVPTVRGTWSLDRCRREKPILRGREWLVEPLLDEAGVPYGYRDDERPGVPTSARKRAVEADFLACNLAQPTISVPVGGGRLDVDLGARTAVEERGGHRTTLAVDRVETGEEVRQGDTATTTRHYLLLAEGARTLVYTDYDRVTAEGPGGRAGVGVAVARLARALREALA